MAQDRDPLDAQPPREAGKSFGVVTHGLENRRVDHPASAQLDPPGALAHLAAGPVALPAADVDLRARLGIGKEARPEPDARRLRRSASRAGAPGHPEHPLAAAILWRCGNV